MLHNIRVTLVVEATTDLSVEQAADAMADALREWGEVTPSDGDGTVAVLIVTSPENQEIG